MIPAEGITRRLQWSRGGVSSGFFLSGADTVLQLECSMGLAPVILGNPKIKPEVDRGASPPAATTWCMF